MKSRVKNAFKNKKLLKNLSIGIGLSLATTTIILPTVYYATAQNFLYLDSLGNVKNNTTPKIKYVYKGDFTPNQQYKVGDVVSVKEVRFQNLDLLPQFETTYNQIMYTFTKDWLGADFAQAPVEKYTPKNLTSISVPLSEFITDDAKITSFMGNSNVVSGIGKSSVTGKFNGTGAIYDSHTRAGEVTIDENHHEVRLSNLNQLFTWNKVEKTPYKYDHGWIEGDDVPNVVNSFPKIGDSKEKINLDRYAFNKAGMYALQLSNNLFDNNLSIVDDWQSNIVSGEYVEYADLLIHEMGTFNPTYTWLSTDRNKTFYLSDDSLGVYIYTKSANFPFSSRAVTDDIFNTTWTGFYAGLGEPLYQKKGETNWRYLTSKDQTSSKSVSYPSDDGTPAKRNFDVGFQAEHGAYVYSMVHQKYPWDDPNTFLKPGTFFDRDTLNKDRDVSYINGIFSINKPSTFLNQGETQNIRWYVPLASTDYSYTIDENKVEELKGKVLASDAISLAHLSQYYSPYLYNAIPSTFYGAEMVVTADNTTGTVWINLKSGPTVEVSNGALMDNVQLPGGYVGKSHYLLGMDWQYGSVNEEGSRYLYYNNSNPVSEVMMGQPIDHTIAITGFQEIQPTKIVTTTNLKGEQFIPGSSTADETKYGPYRLTGSFSNKTPFEYIKEEEAKPANQRYSDLLTKIMDDLVYNKGPTFVNEVTNKPFISVENLLRVSDALAYNFADQDYPERGGRLQFSVSLNAYFSEEGLYIENGGFQSVPVMFSGFKAIPGPTTITTNYNLESLVPGGAIEFNRQNLGTANGVNYPSDYLDPSSVPAGTTVYQRLEDFVYKWSNKDPFVGGGADNLNSQFTSSNYMIKNLPDLLQDGSKPFTITENDIQFNNFAGILKITPKFSRYYDTNGDLITGVNSSLGTITISGFPTVDGSTFIPPVVQAISSELQPSAIVTGGKNVDAVGNYIGQELYKIAWNETINLPTKNYELPPYGKNDLTTEQLEEIRKVIDIKIKPNETTWVDNKNGFLKFAIAYKRIFDVNGVVKQISPNDLWPNDWENDKPDDHIFFVTTYGYNNSPGPTSVLQQLDPNGGGPVNRDIIINQPNFQPSEFIKNDAVAGYPLLRSLIQGNLVNLPSNFDPQNIILSVDDYNANNGITWDPVGDGNPLPLTPNNADGSIEVQVYLTNWYNINSKLSNSADDNQNLPYTSTGQINQGPEWKFTIHGFMKTTAKGETDLSITDNDFLAQFNSANTIDLSNDGVYNFFDKKYPKVAEFKNMLPYELGNTSTLNELLLTKNKSQATMKNQPYLFIKNLPDNIKPYNMFVKKENIVVNNIEGSVSFKLTLKQWYTNEQGNIIYHPTIEDQSQGIVEYTTKTAFVIKGLKNIKNSTIIKPVGDNVDDNSGTINITKNSTSESIINGILLDKWLNENPDNANNLQNYKPFVIDENQPAILDDIDLKVYLYVALYESGGSPYTLEKGSMVEKTVYNSYHINNLNALNEFITWKIRPFYDLQSGIVNMYPMLNLWFGGNDAQIFKQYQAFGAGDSGKPVIGNNSSVTPASISTVTLSGFIKASDALDFNGGYVFDGQSIVQNLNDNNDSILLSKYTAGDFIKTKSFVESVYNLKFKTTAIVSIEGQTVPQPITIPDIFDFNDPSWYKVNEINGTIELKTRVLKYFDGNRELQTGRVTVILSGFKPSVSAYQTTYIVLIITIVALVIVLSIILSRILWVKYNNTRKIYSK